MTDIEIELNIDNNQKTFQTDIITGDLNALLISSENKVSITIESELGYLIFHRPEFQGTSYIAPRTRAVAQFSDQVGLQDIPNFDKFSINERLNILIIGPNNSQVSLILRID